MVNQNEAQSYSQADVQKAFKFLGLEVGDYAGVDKAYKTLAKKFHPDLGGDPEKMKELNNAKDALEQGAKATQGSSYDPQWWANIKKEYEEGNAALIASLDAKMKPLLDSYTVYFKQQTGKDYVMKSKTRSSENTATFDAEWVSDDKSRYFTLSFWLRYSKPSAGALGSSQNKEFDAYFESYMFIDNKKVKVGKREWKKFNADEFKDPEVIFPPAKIKKAVAGSKDKPIKRADFIKFLQVSMDAHSNGDSDWWYIPLGGKKGEVPHALALHRYVIMRTPSWTISIAGQVGSEQYRHYSTGSKFAIKNGLTYTSLYENRKLMEYLPKIVKEAEKASKTGDGTEFQAYLNKVKEEINKVPTSEAKLVDLLKKSIYDQRVNESETSEGAIKMENKVKPLSEQYIESFDAKDHVSLADPTTAKGDDKKDNDAPIVEQDEDVPQKLSMAMDRLSKKPTAQKVEIQDILLNKLLGIVKDLPQANRLLKEFAAEAAQIVQKGEDPAAAQ